MMICNGSVAESKGLVGLFEDVLNQPDPTNDLGNLIDPGLGDDYSFESIRKMTQLARTRTQENAQLRPKSMGCKFSFPVECMATKCWEVFIGDQRTKYVCDLPENLQSLEKLSADLSAKRADILSKVEAAEQFQNKRLRIVDSWLTTVTTEEKKVASLIRDSPREIQKLCFGDCCSKNCISSYKFGKKVAQQINTINDLLAETEKEDFKSLIGPQPLSQVDLIPLESPVGLDSTFDRAWGFIQNEDVGVIGLYGPGGVGKTTLVKKIHNKFCDSTDFVVIWVVVSKGCNPEKLQEDIGKSIRFSDDSWKMKSYEAKARDIFRILDRNKFALFLDDIWEHVDLTEMGIPCGSKLNGSKIIFTTRSFQVCGQMQANEKISVEYLKTPEAFELFCEKVGKDTLDSDPKILELAKMVAKECAGLPLALITVARAMTGKQTPEEWEYAIEVLRRHASEFSTMTEKVYSRLKFSYDHLPNKMAQSCFLYCCLFPDDFNILKSDLIEYWNCEGFLGEKNEIYNRGRGFDIIGTLLNACLLEKHEVGYVKMHDVTREMAFWIAQEFEKDEHGFFVRAGSMLREVPQVEEWKGARRVSLMHNNIEQLQEVPSCSNLLTLFLNDNKLKMINSRFFQSMPSLVALDLSNNGDLVELPSEISNLVCLEYLNLSRTSLRELPIGLNALVRLKYVNLQWTHLRHIPCNLISKFPKLQMLKMMQYSLLNTKIYFEDTSFFKELQSLEYLNTLTININSNAAFHEFQKLEKLQNCTLQLSFSGIEEVRVSILLNMKRLECLEMMKCTNIVDDIDMDIERVREDNEGMKLQNVVDSTICGNRFHSLNSVIIEWCTHVVDLTWLINAPNLTDIRVFCCNELEEVISMEKLGEGQNLNMFAKLEYLALLGLPKLKSICKYALSFPYLKELRVGGCENLMKLPVNLSTSKDNKFTIYGSRNWWTGLEWEDEATETAFRNRFEEL